MSRYDEQLKTLQAQCARKKKLEAAAAELRNQQEDYTARARELEQVFRKEQADVDRLEGRSLSAFFYSVVGRMDEKLTREQQEAYAARVKYDAAARELAGIQADLRRCEAELEGLKGCEARCAAVLEEKAQALKASGGPAAMDILRLEERMAYLDGQERELKEACAAGEAALATADQIADNLDSADGWGTWDLLGGGLISDLAKHSHLDDAQAAVEQLQSQLRRFKTELADVTIQADFQISIDGFLRMADYLFDGIFADWAVLNRIHQSQTQVQDTRAQICRVLEHLRSLLSDAASEQAELRARLRQLVADTPV